MIHHWKDYWKDYWKLFQHYFRSSQRVWWWKNLVWHKNNNPRPLL